MKMDPFRKLENVRVITVGTTVTHNDNTTQFTHQGVTEPDDLFLWSPVTRRAADCL